MSTHQTTTWTSYFQDIGLDESIYGHYIPYIDALLQRRLPVILEFAHLAGLLGRTDGYLASVIHAPKKHYRTFSIKKKSGGDRKIDAPYPALLECQKWIYTNILKNVRVNTCSHGFRPNRSIVTNATCHIGSEEILNVDIKDFFPSITINRVIKIFLDLGYPRQVSYHLASICCLNKKLPQGAPTSPAISNIVAKQMDARLSKLCEKNGIKYTRYADDLTFSGTKIPHWFVSMAGKIIADCGFSLNAKKTRVARSASNRKMVTGIVLKPDRIAVPRSYRRKLIQETYFIREFGLQSHLSKKKIADPQYLLRLQGRLSYWRYVEPESTIAIKNWALINKIRNEL